MIMKSYMNSLYEFRYEFMIMEEYREIIHQNSYEEYRKIMAEFLEMNSHMKLWLIRAEVRRSFITTTVREQSLTLHE